MAIQSVVAILTSDASGDASATVDVNGVVRRVINIPDTDSSQPTDLYDITITDAFSVQLYQDLSVSNSANSHAIPTLAGTAGNTEYQLSVVGELTITGANMGDSKGAKVVLLIER